MIDPLYTPIEKKYDPAYTGYFAGTETKKFLPVLQMSRSLTGEENELMTQRLNQLMNEKKPFLMKGYRLKDLADDLGLPIHQLSAFINQALRMHFTDYMNKFRIKHCLELLNTNLKGRPDLNQLAQTCGFNNRSSFTSAFKKFTGQPPFEYIKRQLFIQLMVSLQRLNGR